MCAILLALSGCTNEINDEGFVDKANGISFSAYSAKTRAYETYERGDVTIDEMKKGSFGVVGYTQADKKLYLGSTEKAIEQVWNEGNSTWDYKNNSEMKYWPASSMDFFAYFPYSNGGANFAESKEDGTIMTIHSEEDNKDVLFSYVTNQTQTGRVPLYFRHALSKLASLNIQIKLAQTEIEVSKVEFLNTSTKGDIMVNSDGKARYEPTSPNAIRSFDFTALPKRITTGDAEGVTLFTNEDNGYIFATNTTETHNVYGTRKTMWDGIKSSITGNDRLLSKSDLICLKLTCKVKAANEYLVGDASNYGEMFIPMRGTSSEDNLDITELLAGKRYTYKIVMTNNVGYDDNGDPIKLTPIRFTVNEVSDWNDVTVTIKL